MWALQPPHQILNGISNRIVTDPSPFGPVRAGVGVLDFLYLLIDPYQLVSLCIHVMDPNPVDNICSPPFARPTTLLISRLLVTIGKVERLKINFYFLNFPCTTP